MALVTVKDFFDKIKEHIKDETVVLGFMEDFGDSFSEKTLEQSQEVTVVDYESDDNPYKAKYKDVYEKYESRFFGKKNNAGIVEEFTEKEKEKLTTDSGEVDDIYESVEVFTDAF